MVKQADSDVSEKELLQHIRSFIDKGIISKQVVLLKVKFVAAIDKTSAGKVNKKALREKYQLG